MKRKSPKDSKYPDNWNGIAKAVKDTAGWKCVRCGHVHDPKAGYTLTVHHLDIDPSNCAWWNIPALCQRCHLSIQSKVIMERPYMFPHSDWFKPYVAAYYAAQNGLIENTKDYYRSLEIAPIEKIMKHLEDYLGLGFTMPAEIGN